MKRLRTLLLSLTVTTGLIASTTIFSYASTDISNRTISSKTIEASSSLEILSCSIGEVSGYTISDLPCTTTVEDLENSLSIIDGYEYRILEKSKRSAVKNKQKYINSDMVISVNDWDYKFKEYKLKVVTEHKIIDTIIGTLSSSRIIDIPRDTYTKDLKAGLTLSNGATAEVLTKSKGRVIDDEELRKVTSTMVVEVTGMDGKTSVYKLALIKNDDTKAPTNPRKLTASNVTGSGVTLSWVASLDNIGVTGYDVYCNNKIVVSSTSTSVEITGLSPNTTYVYYVKARDAAENVSSSSNRVTVKTTDN